MTSKELFYERKTAFERIDNEKAQSYANEYKKFLDAGKTERDAADEIIRLAKDAGFKHYERGMNLKAGDKIYKVNRNKAVILSIIGSEPLNNGIRLTAAHIDAPRIDIRTVPLYEQDGMAFFKTHYYGGIKKYQWLAIPLEIRGVVCVLKDGQTQTVKINIGANENDPKFVITDLLPHLASKQMQQKMVDGIKAEGMNVLIASKPQEDEKDCKDKIKLAVMKHLNEKYGMREIDFLSAELSCVPAYNACDIGFDRSMVGAYGHDDRVCSYSAARSIIDLKETPKHTAVCLLVDKEEIGSDGVTGMQSRFFDAFMEDICKGFTGECYENSICLSTDVCNAYDPNYADVSEPRNDGRLNCGFAIMKYSGSRGKSGTSDASAEVMARVRNIMECAGVPWQTAQLGKVDQGGGGTVAMYIANRNIETVDAGVPVLSMHSPFEVISKVDLYCSYLGMSAFYKS